MNLKISQSINPLITNIHITYVLMYCSWPAATSLGRRDAAPLSGSHPLSHVRPLNGHSVLPVPDLFDGRLAELVRCRLAAHPPPLYDRSPEAGVGRARMRDQPTDRPSGLADGCQLQCELRDVEHEKNAFSIDPEHDAERL